MAKKRAAKKSAKKPAGPDTSKPPFAAPDWPAATVTMWPLRKIKPYPTNPRTHPEAQVALLAKSMLDEGVTMPILVDEAGVVIAGHGRLQAAQRNAFEEYPVVVARGWTEKQKRAARIKDNSLGLMSGWEANLLRADLNSLSLSGYDMQLIGFDSSVLADYMTPPPPPGADPEKTPETPHTPVSRTGDLWVLGKHRLLCGDSTNAEDVTRALDGANPHLMVTDPPYGVDYDPDWRNLADRANGKPYGASAVGTVSNDKRTDWREAWNLFAGDVVYCWHPAGANSVEFYHSLTDSEFSIRMQIIWNKSNFPIGRGDYHVKHEPCWYAVRKGKTGHWNGDRKQTTVWDIPKPSKSETGHSTQKPVECMRRPIQNNSKPGDFVYEPFSGSGTTIIAAEMMKRYCRAIEISPAYVDVGVRRWQEFAKQKATLAGDGRTFDEVAAARAKKKENQIC